MIVRKMTSEQQGESYVLPVSSLEQRLNREQIAALESALGRVLQDFNGNAKAALRHQMVLNVVLQAELDDVRRERSQEITQISSRQPQGRPQPKASAAMVPQTQFEF